MKKKFFIENLSLRNADYNNPEQAITTANLCDTISRDINTDSQRFIYELLQNADDSSNKYGKLDFRIDFVDNYIVVSHKGEAFSEIDIESISSAGDGTKTNDNNKTGFKGIGFKSVFAHSNSVIIKTGEYCFKFDKDSWANYWNEKWGSRNEWQESRRLKNKNEGIKMPWQILPIWSDIPSNIQKLSVFNDYNVSTIIAYKDVSTLKKDLTDLFSKSQIILFLRSKEVKIEINSDESILLEKTIANNITILKRNNVVISQWLINNKQFGIPKDIQEAINEDEKSPRKLKDATNTEISFAIEVKHEKLKAVETSNRLIFTYLPTSINYNFPFLVNASFLTDAGRQHLHQDTVWNKWIFEQIPILYFSWIAELANKNSAYNKQVFNVLPNKLGYSLLEQSFNKGYEYALENIAFIPNLKGDLLKIKEALFDKTQLSEYIDSDIIVSYINNSEGKSFTKASYIPYYQPFSVIKNLGVKVFDIPHLEKFFSSNNFKEKHNLNDNFSLIEFLYKQASTDGDKENSWNNVLKDTAFIFDEKEVLKSPSEIYFPAQIPAQDFSSNISFIHETTMDKIDSNDNIKQWLEILGIKEPSDINFIEKTIINDISSFITIDNAIAVGRYLFETYKKGLLKQEHFNKLRNFKVLTKKGTLINIKSSFLSNFYEPILKLENNYNNDFYVSESYFKISDLKSEWKTFLLKIGANENITINNITVKHYKDKDVIEEEYFNYVLEQAKPQISYIKFQDIDNDIIITKISYSELAIDNYNFAQLFWEQVFLNIDIKKIDNKSIMYWGYYYTKAYVDNYFDWSLENSRFIPTTQNNCLIAKDVFSNDIADIYEIGGKYLPIFTYKGAIPPEWREKLKFKTSLSIDDYLSVLSGIWQEENPTVELMEENKKRINIIYDKLSSMNLHSADKDKIKEWANNNKLLSKNGKDFYSPKDLSIVSVRGFGAAHLAYGDKDTLEIIALFRLFGVKIIDKVSAELGSQKTERSDLKSKLLQIAPLIALVSIGKSNIKKDWETEYNRIKFDLTKLHFFETSDIYLSYGNDLDKQKRSSYAEQNNFYYVGRWDSPRILDGLVEPLGAFIKIRYAERILTVLLLERLSEGVEYLKEKGYDISLIPADLLMEPIVSNVYTEPNRTYNNEDANIGHLGESILYDYLKDFYAQKYNSTISETEEGFKIEDVEVIWLNKNTRTTTNHDFRIVENGNTIYIECKATPYNRGRQNTALYLSENELDLMKASQRYLLARVYNVYNTPSIEFIRMQLDNTLKKELISSASLY